jgi:hypothetical protein
MALRTGNPVNALLGLERAYAELGWADSLLLVVDSLVQRYPTDASIRGVQLRTLQALGRDVDLERAVERWAREVPGDPTPYREHARLLLQRGQAAAAAEVIDGVWIAERSVEAMRDHPALGEHFDACRRRVENVRRLVAAYVAGDASPLREVAAAAQWLAHLDALFRTGELRRPHIGLDLRVHEELLALAEAFDPARLFAGAGRVFLNPVYAEAARVGGADPDLVVDDFIVDIKTTIRLRVDPAHLRQLAGYAAMQRLGGLRLPDGLPSHDRPACWIGIYFARHGVLQRWALEEILPGAAFDRFLETFCREAETLHSEATAAA